MKIAFFTDTYAPHLNGVAVFVEVMAKALRKVGHKVYIFAPSVRGYKDIDPNVIRIPSVSIPRMPEAVRAPILIPHKYLIKIYKLDIDIVHAHGNGAFSFIGYQVAKLKRVPYVCTFHTMLTEYTHYIFYGKVLKPNMVKAAARLWCRFCDAIITPSAKMKDALHSFGVKKEIFVIPNFIDHKKFAVNEKDYLRKNLGLSKDAKILLSVGRLGKEKSFDFLLKVFKKLLIDEKNSHLAIVGYGPLENNLFRLSRKLKIEDRVHFIGKIEQKKMPSVYKSADLFVFASKTEVHPMVIIEAVSAGLPIVVVNDKAYEDLVVDNFNGFLLPKNQEIFVRKIRELLKDKALSKEFSKNSKKIAKNNFGEEKSTKKLLEIYKKTILQNDQHKNKKSSLDSITAIASRASSFLQKAI